MCCKGISAKLNLNR